MNGFTDKALILFPTLESWENESQRYKTQFNWALHNILKYMEDIDVTLYYFYTDDYARLNMSTGEYIQTLDTTERFFCMNNVEYMSDIMSKTKNYDEELHKKLCSKTMLQMDMDESMQFEIVEQHDKKMCSHYIKDFKAVIEFATDKKSRYNLSTKRIQPGHLHLVVLPGTFIVKAYFGPTEEDIVTLLQRKDASLPVSEWS